MEKIYKTRPSSEAYPPKYFEKIVKAFKQKIKEEKDQEKQKEKNER